MRNKSTMNLRSRATSGLSWSITFHNMHHNLQHRHGGEFMAEKNTAVFGIYSNLEQAESAVDQLLSAGFSNSDVSVLVSDSDTTRDFAHRKATKAPEGTATGAAAGGLLGGTLGLLAGIEHFSFSYIPLKHSLNHAWALAGEI